MSNAILVTYASRTGFTTGVAEAIGKTLIEQGAQVEVRPMNEVKDLTPYRAVVAGSAIRRGEWLPEAMQFMRTHQAILARKPFATFTVCMTMSMANETYREGVAKWLEPVRALVKPVSEGYFAGGLDFSKLPLNFRTLLMRATVRFGVWSKGDHRDWKAIRTWAIQLKPRLEI